MPQLTISIIQTTGLGVFIYYLIRGLHAKINGLEGVVNTQKQTIETMNKRIEETEKVGGIYRNLISDLPADLDNYKTIVSKTKDEIILELKNQNEETAKKLDEAKKVIESSGNPQEQINMHLAVLKNLLSEPVQRNESHFKNAYELKAVSEFNGRTLESSVSQIIKSKTLDEFLRNMGYDVNITENDSVFKIIFSDERKTPDGEHIEAAIGSHSITGGWNVIANNKIWVNQARINEWKDEFSSIKTIT